MPSAASCWSRPVVDWVDHAELSGATLLRVPPLIRQAALGVISTRWSRAHHRAGRAPIDFAGSTSCSGQANCDMPILLLHSDDDGFVPSTASRALAAARPDIVSYWPWHTARHTRAVELSTATAGTPTIARWLSSSLVE